MFLLKGTVRVILIDSSNKKEEYPIYNGRCNGFVLRAVNFFLEILFLNPIKAGGGRLAPPPKVFLP